MFSRYILAFAIILSTVFISVNAIRCYQCSSSKSTNDTECHDLSLHHPHLTSGFFKECSNFEKYGNATPFCRKTVVEIIIPREENRTTRSCGRVQYRLPGYKADNDDHLETSCQCFEDGCNSPSHVYAMSALALLVLGFICFKL